MLGLIGKKVGMTQTYDQHDNLVPITVVQAGPCPVVQVKEDVSDGYLALKLGFGATSERRLTRPQLGVLKKSGAGPHRILKEFSGGTTRRNYEVGQILDTCIFEPGEYVSVTGRSKGKGFQGVVKRHHFKGGPKTHGQSDRHRAPGSIGQSSDPSRVFKGMRMAGHMGHRRETVKGLMVVRVDKERNLLLLKGAVPGPNGGIVKVQKQRN